MGAGGGCLDTFTHIYRFSFLSPSLWETARYRLKYRLKGPLSPTQPTNQILPTLLYELEKKVELKEEELIQSNYNHKVKQERDSLLSNLHTIVQMQANGAKIRSRAKWVEEGERAQNIFFNLEKHNNISRPTLA